MTLGIDQAIEPRWKGRRQPAVLGVVMIVKNEGDNLPDLFRTIADVADEVVVVDTGSTDDTVEVCREWGARVVHEVWRDDFAHARNRSIAEATASHLLWLDGDDRLPPETRACLRELRDQVLPRAPRQAYLMDLQNLNAAGEVFESSVQVRIFPRLPGVRFKHAIHEEIASSLVRAGIGAALLPAAVHHVGYSDASVNLEKARRNEAMLRAALAKDPADIHARVHLAQSLAILGELAQAEREITTALASEPASDISQNLLAELHALRSLFRLRMKDRPGAIADLDRAILLRPKWAFPYAALAEIRFAGQELDKCWDMVERARSASFQAVILGFPVRQAQRNLELCAGRILIGRGELDEGASCLLRALQTIPSAFAVRLEAAQALLEALRFAEARDVLEPALQEPTLGSWLVEVLAGLALARVGTGDEAGAAGCLAPLLDVFAERLGGAEDVSPLELAEAMLREGHAIAAKNLMSLYQRTLLPVA